MFIRQKQFDGLVKDVNKLLLETNNRIDAIEYVVTKIVEKLENMGKVLESDTNIKEAMAERVLKNKDIIDALLKSDEDRIKALNLTMDKEIELEQNFMYLVKILNEKGFITADDFKGD